MLRAFVLMVTVVCSSFSVVTQQSEATKAAAPLLRRVATKHLGFNDGILNDDAVEAEARYVQQRGDGYPQVERAYDQSQVDRTKEALTAFWKERGINVEVSSELASVSGRERYADLKFVIRKM